MKLDTLLEYFPVPKYLELPTVGIDISDNFIRYVELTKVGGAIKLGKYGKKVLDEGKKEYVGDDTINNEHLKKELMEVKEKISFVAVNASLPEDQAYFLRLRLPGITASEIRGAIELQIEDHVPYTAEEVIFDYEIMNKKNESHVDVAVAVVPKIISEKYLNIVKLAGLNVSSLIIESEATAKAVVPKDSDATYVVVNIGKNKTVISIVSRGTVWISDSIKAGEDLLTGLIAKYLKIEFSDAETIKYKNGLSEMKENLAFEPLALGLSSIRDEIIRYNMYWAGNKEEIFPGNKEVAQVILCGRDANIPGIDSYLSSSLKIPTVVANPWVNVDAFEKHIPDMSRRESLQYVTAIGLALSNLF